jgi:hypothetical protein
MKAAGMASGTQCARAGITSICFRMPMPAPGTPAYAAAQRFAALPAATRHAWLVTHLTALRAGHLGLAQLP